ncbi:MAG: MobC family plasmid mobilization relaxosome protein [Defluviitaleaceae bacterium]|nr:MobC family plasmid mobilization relaxosome protein [Defluviitaleaceae bacterium]MCL2275474.1 MobC family plasmid mobilization relaxosome protein [Defluviitaleaceae bacterium]
MAKVKEKTTGFYFKMSPAEWEMVERRMSQTGIRNKSAFIRKMCIDGHVFNLDLTTLNEIKRLLGITANNVNQIAHRVNSGGDAHRNDVADVNAQLTTIRSDFGNLLSLLTEIADAKPGKRFIKPPTLRDLPAYQASLNNSELSTNNTASMQSPNAPTTAKGA